MEDVRWKDVGKKVRGRIVYKQTLCLIAMEKTTRLDEKEGAQKMGGVEVNKFVALINTPRCFGLYVFLCSVKRKCENLEPQ